MQRAPFGRLELPMENPQFSLQPMAAAEPGLFRESLQTGQQVGPQVLCLFPGCEFKSPDVFALEYHQQQKHIGTPVPGKIITLPLSEVSPPRAVATNSQGPCFDLSPFVNGVGPSADSPTCYATLNAQRMAMSQPEYFGHTTSLYDGLRLASPGQSCFPFAGGHNTVRPTTNPQSHFPQHPHMGIIAPQGPSIQYTPNQVQTSIQQNAHRANPSNVPSRRYRCQHPGCNKTASRHSDLNRHMRTHQAGVKGFDCPDPGCNRKGVKGFPRKDKMLDHYHAVHQ